MECIPGNHSVSNSHEISTTQFKSEFSILNMKMTPQEEQATSTSIKPVVVVCHDERLDKLHVM
jgi:hypothetical protein